MLGIVPLFPCLLESRSHLVPLRSRFDVKQNLKNEQLPVSLGVGRQKTPLEQHVLVLVLVFVGRKKTPLEQRVLVLVGRQKTPLEQRILILVLVLVGRQKTPLEQDVLWKGKRHRCSKTFLFLFLWEDYFPLTLLEQDVLVLVGRQKISLVVGGEGRG